MTNPSRKQCTESDFHILRRFLAALAISATLVVSACGSGSSESPGPSPGDSQSDPPPGPSVSGLVVHEPIPFRAAAPDVPIRAECGGQNGGSCEFDVSIRFDHDDHFLAIASSTNGRVDMVADLSSYDWHEGYVTFRATFSTGESADIYRYVYVEHSPALHRVARVDGEILDTNGDRILYMLRTETENRFFVQSLSDGSIVQLSAPGDMELIDDDYGWLTTQGALLVIREEVGGDALVIDAREDEYRELAGLGEMEETTVAASGDYAIWRIGDELMRWRFSTSEALLIADDACRTSADVLEDGSVAYCGVDLSEGLSWSARSEDVYFFTAGGTVRITHDEAWKENVRSDGSNFVYKKLTKAVDWEDFGILDAHLAVHDGVSERLLVADQDEFASSSYMMEGGWVAYQWSTDFSDSTPLEPLWVTHVQGAPFELGETFVGSMEGVGIDGSVVTSGIGFRLRSSALGELQFSKNTEDPWEHGPFERIAPSVRQLNGTWFFLKGDSLFEVRP